MGTPVKVLLIEKPMSSASIIYNALVDEGYGAPTRANYQDDILKTASNARADLLIINVEEPNNDMIIQLKTINEVCPIPVVIFSKKGGTDIIQSAIQAGVSAFIVDGLSAKKIKPVLNVALARFNNYSQLRKELAKTRESLANRKVIEKAKGLIMEQRQCTEDEAYNLLRKVAMDRNQKLNDVANNLIEQSPILS